MRRLSTRRMTAMLAAAMAVAMLLSSTASANHGYRTRLQLVTLTGTPVMRGYFLAHSMLYLHWMPGLGRMGRPGNGAGRTSTPELARLPMLSGYQSGDRIRPRDSGGADLVVIKRPSRPSGGGGGKSGQRQVLIEARLMEVRPDARLEIGFTLGDFQFDLPQGQTPPATKPPPATRSPDGPRILVINEKTIGDLLSDQSPEAQKVYGDVLKALNGRNAPAPK